MTGPQGTPSYSAAVQGPAARQRAVQVAAVGEAGAVESAVAAVGEAVADESAAAAVGKAVAAESAAAAAAEAVAAESTIAAAVAAMESRAVAAAAGARAAEAVTVVIPLLVQARQRLAETDRQSAIQAIAAERRN